MEIRKATLKDVDKIVELWNQFQDDHDEIVISKSPELKEYVKRKSDAKESYKKHITDVVNASITNTPYSVDLQEKYKDKINWQLFIDNREKRLCFVIWSINEELY